MRGGLYEGGLYEGGSFILVYVDILQIVNIVTLDVALKNCTLATKNASSPTVFDHRSLKQTSFCRELDCQDRHSRSFSVLDLVPLKEHNTDEKT